MRIMKKTQRIWALVLACMLALGASGALATSDAPTGLLINGVPFAPVQADGVDGYSSIEGAAAAQAMLNAYAQLLSASQGGGMQMELLFGTERLSSLEISLYGLNLADAQGLWHAAQNAQTPGNKIGAVPVTLMGARASAQFNTNAQNAVRRAAVTGVVYNAGTSFLRLFATALADTLGLEPKYPDFSYLTGEDPTVRVTVKALDELYEDEQARLNAFNPVGGARVTVDMYIGGEIPVTSLKAGTGVSDGAVTITTPVNVPAGTTAASLSAQRIDENGNVTHTYPITALGAGTATFSTDMLGDYVIVSQGLLPVMPSVPSTGDRQPLLLWGALLAVSALGMAWARRRKAA